MSRTYRRKGYEKTQNTSWDKQFNSVAGFYTEYDYEWIHEPHCWADKIEIYRKPTKKEFGKKYWRIHADGFHNYSRISGYWKSHCNARVRRANKEEIFRWLKNEDYDIIPRNSDDVFDIWFYN